MLGGPVVGLHELPPPQWPSTLRGSCQQDDGSLSSSIRHITFQFCLLENDRLVLHNYCYLFAEHLPRHVRHLVDYNLTTWVLCFKIDQIKKERNIIECKDKKEQGFAPLTKQFMIDSSLDYLVLREVELYAVGK